MQILFCVRSCWAVGPLGRWAVGPLGRWAVGPLGRWAVGPLGRWAVGPLGRWAVGPLGRWAVGPLGRWAVAMTMLGVVGLASSAKAQDEGTLQAAGEWKVSYEYSGTAEGKASYGVQDVPAAGYVSEPFAFDLASESVTTPFLPKEHMGDNAALRAAPVYQSFYDYFDWLMQGRLSASGSRQGANISALGGPGEAHYKPTIKVVWDWVPQAGYTDAGPVPEFINFVVTGEATAHTNGNSANEQPNNFSYGTEYGRTWNPADVWNGTASLDITGLDAMPEATADDNSGGGAAGDGSGGSAVTWNGAGGTSGALTAGALTTGSGMGDDLIATQTGTDNTWSRKRSQLFTIETRGRTHIDDGAPVSFDVKAQIKSERHNIMKNGAAGLSYAPVAGTAQAGATLIAAQDDRTVAIEREGATNEYVTTVGGVKVTHGDTIYSFTEHHSMETPTWVPVPQKFVSILGGKWSKKLSAVTSGGYDITWNWRGDGKLESYRNLLTPTNRQAAANSYERWNGLSRVSPKGELEPWYNLGATAPPTYTDEGATKHGGRPPMTTTMKYFARDNQTKTLAEARYELTIHEPIQLEGPIAFVKRYNILSPAYFHDPKDGKWKLVAALNGDEHIYLPGEYSYTVTRGEARARGWSAGFEGGLDLGIEAVLGYNHNEEVSWSKEHGGTVTLSEKIGPGEAAYLEVVFPRQILRRKYRLYDAAGEIRSAGSPAVPKASIPYSKTWEEQESAATQRWHKVKANEIVPTNENDLPVIQGDSGASS